VPVADLFTKGRGIVVVNCLCTYPVEMPGKVVDGTGAFNPIFISDDPTVRVGVPTLTCEVKTSPNGIVFLFGSVSISLKLRLYTPSFIEQGTVIVNGNV